MAEKIKINETEMDKGVLTLGEKGAFRFIYGDDKSLEGVVLHANAPKFTLSIGGKIETIYAVRQKGQTLIWYRGTSYAVEDVVLRRGGSAKAEEKITPSMPGIVVKVSVAEGEAVKAGQELLVISAMKMESSFKAPFDGVVRAIRVKVDDNVRPGEELIELAKEER